MVQFLRSFMYCLMASLVSLFSCTPERERERGGEGGGGGREGGGRKSE